MADTETIKSILSNTLPLLSTRFDTTTLENSTHIPRATAQSAPTTSFPSGTPSPSKLYLLTNIDLDAPFASFAFMSPILHFLQTDLVLSPSGTLESSQAPLVEWAAPRPPPGAGAHRYVSVLYEQPEGFRRESVVPEGGMGLTARMRFDYAGFEKKAGVGKAVAGGWFTSN